MKTRRSHPIAYPEADNPSVICLKCGFENDTLALECTACGVVLSKMRSARTSRPVPETKISPSQWKILAIGLTSAIVLFAVPPTRFICSALVTLFHEFGHAVMGWLMGYPSLPAFDLVYGGGLTSHGEFRLSIVIAIACAFAYCGWRIRTNRVAVVILGILFLIWVLFVSREWRRELAFASAGHLGELILATIFLYKALFDEGWRWPQAERPAAAFVAAFVQINSIAFCLKLLGNPEFLAWYREGKGGAMMNDMEVIALDIHIWLGPEPGIEGIARWLCALSFLPSLAALLLYLQRPKWASLSDVDRYG